VDLLEYPASCLSKDFLNLVQDSALEFSSSQSSSFSSAAQVSST
jgi:hypothetical protein